MVNITCEAWEKIIREQFGNVSEKYTGLSLAFFEDKALVYGPLEFRAKYEEQEIEEIFKVEIIIPIDYPKSPPAIRELEGRIPKDFHSFTNGNLCLASLLEIQKKFRNSPTLLGYIEELVIPFLFGFCVYKETGRMPFGELSHNGQGILEYYREFLEVDNDAIALELLKYLAEGGYAGHGHRECPCGSKKRLRDCHGPRILEILPYADYNKCLFLLEYYLAAEHYEMKNQLTPGSLITNNMKRIIKRISK